MKKITFIITGMHCTSCAMNIDGELEDTDGVHESTTNYAKQRTVVTYEPEKITEQKLIQIIKTVGYTAMTEVAQ